MDYFHPGAEEIARLLAKTTISPEAVVACGTLVGAAGGVLLGMGARSSRCLWAGAALLIVKNVLDKTDGSLARLTGTTSRRGRFLDSLGDFVVSCATFAGIAAALAPRFGAPWSLACAAFALLSSLLQCSYFVYYQTMFIGKVLCRETPNRADESFTREDGAAPPLVQALQKTHLLIYGWQDKLIARGDKFLYARARTRSQESESAFDARWFGDAWNLRLASLLGLGTHIFLTACAAILGRLDIYLLWAALGGNCLMALLFVRRGCRTRRMA